VIVTSCRYGLIVGVGLLWSQAGEAAARGDILINGSFVHPESITSTPEGALFTGSLSGVIYRAGPHDTTAEPFIAPNAANGLRAVFGVLADVRAHRLWACSVANPFVRSAAPAAPSELVAFDLNTGTLQGRWAFPSPGGVCNDIAVARDGTAYASDTTGGRILRLRRGKNLEVAAEDAGLKGIDGLDFGAHGELYVNIVTRGELLRVELPTQGSPLKIVKLAVDQAMGGPDGLRHIGNNRFLQAEGAAGRITLLKIRGDHVTTTVLKEGLQSSPGVTRIGATVYAIEGKINYLVDPALRGKDPGPFNAIAIALR
jgi:sugar lactone lactonase YvrE